VPPALSIVFPSYNEARRLPPTLRKVFAYLDEKKIDAEVLVVDDGSKDGMADAVRAEFGSRTNLKVLDYGGNRGKGHAVRHGFLAATGTRVLMSDADLSTPIEDFEVLAEAMEKHGLDIAMGSRALGQVLVAQRGVRSFAGKIYNRIIRTILPLPAFRDTQCGFKLFRRERCRPVFEAMRVDRFSFDVESVFLSCRAGLSVAEVAVRWTNDAESKVRFVRDSSRMFADVIRIRWWSLTGGYPVIRPPARV
jgi:glycosyltransferase involved in cell wall biosynthesis